MKKTVLITGSSSGIGRAAAFYFQKMGWNVAATMRSPEHETELKLLANVKLYTLDVTSEDSIAKAIAAVKTEFGRIDVLVNNAGFAALGIFEAANNKEVQRQFDTNVFGLMSMSKAIIAHYREQGGGTIINVSSIAGRMAFPLYSLYHATKWAVDGFSESLQYELEPFNIRVRIVEPGLIKTDFYGRSQLLLSMNDVPQYQQLLDKGEQTIAAFSRKGSHPDVVAKAIYKAAISKSKKLRYPVAGGASLFIFMRWITPGCIFRAFTRKMYFG